MMRRSRILTLFPYTTLFRSHEDDVGRAERLLVEQRELAHLPGDLEDVQVALEAHHAGRAERALERAPGLRRDAEREAVAVRDGDGLDRLTVREAEEELPRAVARPLVGDELQARQREVLGQRLAERRRQLAHLGEVARGLLPQARQDLRGAVRRLPLRRGELAQHA